MPRKLPLRGFEAQFTVLRYFALDGTDHARATSSNVRPTAFSGTVVVLVWINGPFGGGKTATAFELQRRLPGSIVCDPEHLGFGLHRMLPPALRTNFQDLQAWRSGVREVLDLVARNREGPDRRTAHPSGHRWTGTGIAAPLRDDPSAHPLRLTSPRSAPPRPRTLPGVADRANPA